MKILITGGAGFIGSNLCEHFVGKGYDVTCLDNLSTGFLHNIEPLMAAPNFRFIQGDIRDLDTCREAVKGRAAASTTRSTPMRTTSTAS